MAEQIESPVLLGRRIRSLRKLRGLTQEQLAASADVSGKYLSEVERGETNVTVLILDKLAQGLHVDIQELFDFGHEATRDRLEREIVALMKDASDDRLKILHRVALDILR